MDGGSGQDTFLFATGFGDDEINNFSAGIGSFDRLDLSAFATDLTTLLSNTVDINGNAQISIGGGTIKLNGVTKSQLDLEDFIGITDEITGTNNAETLNGTAGDDTISGLGGTTRLPVSPATTGFSAAMATTISPAEPATISARATRATTPTGTRRAMARTGLSIRSGPTRSSIQKLQTMKSESLSAPLLATWFSPSMTAPLSR